MRKINGLLLICLALAAFMTIAAPHRAYATVTSITDECSDGTFNAAVLAARNAAAQDEVAKIIDITNQFPVLQASNSCIEGIISALNKTAALSDPFNLANGLVTSIITGIINQACSSVMNVVNGVQNLIKNSFSICLPMPNLNLSINANINSSPCAGGVAFSPINFTPTGAPTLNSTGRILTIPHQ